MAATLRGAVVLLALLHLSVQDMTWERDMGEEMEIGPTTEGYKKVDLRCGAESMVVEVETAEDFSGVLYTRGSFGKRDSPCFRDILAGRLFTVRIPFDDCKTRKEGETFSNTLILQHDDDLIMPGDAAFLLECDFSKPRDVPVHGAMPTDLFDVVSKISLSTADPSKKEIPEDLKLHVTNRSQIVSFRPKLLLSRRDEL